MDSLMESFAARQRRFRRPAHKNQNRGGESKDNPRKGRSEAAALLE